MEKIFENLPKPLEWRSFYLNDLPILMDINEEVREVSIQHHRNGSQIMVLESIKDKQLIVSAEKIGLGKEKPRKRI